MVELVMFDPRVCVILQVQTEDFSTLETASEELSDASAEEAPEQLLQGRYGVFPRSGMNFQALTPAGSTLRL